MLTSHAPVHRARSRAEAVALRAAHPAATVLAGGTDVMVVLEAGGADPAAFLDLWACRDLRRISDDGRTIGALATWTDVARHPALPDALRECARTVGAAQIQNRGTVGGNIVNASPAGDSLPVWLVLDATLVVESVRGTRELPAADFWQGYRRTALAPDELLVEVRLPAPHPADRLHYRKVGTRLAQAISKVVLAGRLRVEDGVVTDARVAFGSVAPIPVRARSVEAALVGRPLSAAAAAASAVQADVAPIDDVRSTAAWRRRVAENIVRRWLAVESGGA